MSTPLVSFARRFQVWAYGVSHAQLLLRSNKSDGALTRIDVLFEGVGALEIPTYFQGLTIAEASWEEAPSLGVQLGSTTATGKKLFAIQGENFSGYLAASAVFWHEDSGAFHEPSYFPDAPLGLWPANTR
jgi:hypothetical protein